MVKCFARSIYLGAFLILCLSLSTLNSNNIFKRGKRVDSTLPFADECGIVISTKVLTFKENLDNAYNASIIENKNGYLLIFRHDTTKPSCNVCPYTERQLKIVQLNKNFEQVSPVKTIGPARGMQEDPRAHFWKGNIFVTCNGDAKKHSHTHTPPKSFGKGKKYYAHMLALAQKKLTSQTKTKTNKAPTHIHPVERKMFVGKLDTQKALLPDIRQVPSGGVAQTYVEKNWMPFEYPEYDGDLHYIYSTFPHEIIKISDLDNPKSAKRCKTITQDIYNVWQKDIWGEIKGGTPARIVDDVYLTFFHSWKYSPKDNCAYYVMGAYIFQNQPPFKILAMTPEPILFKDIYSTPQRVEHLFHIYPSGFVIEKTNEKTLLHVSCGENDISVRIVTIDKDALIKSMVAVPALEGNI